MTLLTDFFFVVLLACFFFAAARLTTFLLTDFFFDTPDDFCVVPFSRWEITLELYFFAICLALDVASVFVSKVALGRELPCAFTAHFFP